VPARDVLKLIYRTLTAFVAAVLAAGAVLAWWHSTPANQLMLVSGMLGILALIVVLSIDKLDRQDRQAETLRSIVDDARSRVPLSFHFGAKGAERQQARFGGVRWSMQEGAPVSVDFAEPEVHRVDTAMLDEAKRMAADGASIDEICRMVDPAYDGRDQFHQEAFQRLVRTMIEQA